MIKKRQKWITWLVTLSFAWMMQASTMPLTAAGATGQGHSVSAEQDPNFYEAVEMKAPLEKKSGVLPWILIGVGVAAVAAVLFLVVLKSYDILGDWNLDWKWTVGSNAHGIYPMTFSGSKTSGTVTIFGETGTYTVDGKNVAWILTGEAPDFSWSGQFDGKDAMSGTMTWPTAGVSGTWTATRRVAATSAPKYPLSQETENPGSKFISD